MSLKVQIRIYCRLFQTMSQKINKAGRFEIFWFLVILCQIWGFWELRVEDRWHLTVQRSGSMVRLLNLPVKR